MPVENVQRILCHALGSKAGSLRPFRNPIGGKAKVFGEGIFVDVLPAGEHAPRYEPREHIAHARTNFDHPQGWRRQVGLERLEYVSVQSAVVDRLFREQIARERIVNQRCG